MRKFPLTNTYGMCFQSFGEPETKQTNLPIDMNCNIYAGEPQPFGSSFCRNGCAWTAYALCRSVPSDGHWFKLVPQ